MWRVMSGLHEEISYHFLLPGHTKFAPDWCFGLLKQRTRQTFISSLFDIATAVEESASVNVAELVGLHNGTVLVPCYDWTTFLALYFKNFLRSNLITIFVFTETIQALYSTKSTGTRKKKP